MIETIGSLFKLLLTCSGRRCEGGVPKARVEGAIKSGLSRQRQAHAGRWSRSRSSTRNTFQVRRPLQPLPSQAPILRHLDITATKMAIHWRLWLALANQLKCSITRRLIKQVRVAQWPTALWDRLPTVRPLRWEPLLNYPFVKSFICQIIILLVYFRIHLIG